MIGTRVSRIKRAVKPLTRAVARAEFSFLLARRGAALPAGCSSAPPAYSARHPGAGGNGSSAPAGGIRRRLDPRRATAVLRYGAGRLGRCRGPRPERDDRRRRRTRRSRFRHSRTSWRRSRPRTARGLPSGVIGDGRRVTIQSNISVIGRGGAEFRGGLRVDGGSNVIVRNLKVVGNNCSDSPTDCSGGADAFSIGDGAHHVWVDHCDVSDGSDGNLDINGQADYVTISLTKFSYSGQRPGGHQFSNLIGLERRQSRKIRATCASPGTTTGGPTTSTNACARVRYGRVHLFNNLYTASGNDYCIGLGYYANLLTEHNAFFQVRDPINSTNYSNSQSVVISHDNLYVATSGGTSDKGFPNEVFVPPHPYALDAANDVEALVKNGRRHVLSAALAFATAPSLSCSR